MTTPIGPGTSTVQVRPIEHVRSSPTTSRAPSPPATAQTLFMDGLLCIFEWLRWGDLLPALHSCHYWYTCGAKVRSRQLQIDWNRVRSFSPQLMTSPLRHHIGSLREFGLRNMVLINQIHQLTQIQEFQCVLDADTHINSPLPNSFILPRSLTTLKIELIDRCDSYQLFQSLIHRLPTAPGLTCLDIIYDHTSTWGPHQFDLSSISQLPCLQTLNLDLPYAMRPEDQRICANLPLTKMTFPNGSISSYSLHRLDWGSFHPDSPFMQSIQEWHWGDWRPTQQDWQHLITHPPPQLRALTLEFYHEQPMSQLGLAAFHLTRLTVFRYYDYSQEVEPTSYAHLITPLRSVTSLTLNDPHLNDRQLGEILYEMRLDELHLLSRHSSQFGASLRFLPRMATIAYLCMRTVALFKSSISRAKRLRNFHIDHLRISECVSNAPATLIKNALDEIDQHCQSKAIINIERMTIRYINDAFVNFNYVKSINSHPPAPPLVGVELNPGPISNDLTHMCLTSTTNHQLTLSQKVDGATLFSDGLHKIYSYLTDCEFFQVLRVSRHWSHCCGTGPSRQMDYYSVWNKNSSTHLTSHSRLDYHFTRFEFPFNYVSRLHLTQLSSLMRLLPYLTTIEFYIRKDSIDLSAVDSIQWPINLRSLSCNFEERDYPILFRSICQLSPLTSITLGSVGGRCDGFNPAESFRPLTSLTTLRLFQITGRSNDEFDPFQFKTASTIFFPSTLTELHLSTHHFLNALPRTTDLQNIRQLYLPSMALQPNDLRLIHAHMPELESLMWPQFCQNDLNDIVLFHRLESIHIQFNSPDFLPSVHPLIHLLGELPRLTHLQLKSNIFTTDHDWSLAYHSLTHLTSLQIDGVSDHPIPFTHMRIFADRLKRLTITCLSITSNDLVIMSTFHELEYLSLYHYLVTPESDCNRLKVFFDSCDILPHLRELHLRCGAGTRQRFDWNQQSRGSDGYRPVRQQIRDSTSDTTAVTLPTKPLVSIETNPVESHTTTSLRPVHLSSSTSTITPQTMFRDGLHIIYSFLSTNDWLHTLQTCTNWFAGGRTEPCRWVHISHTCRQPLPSKSSSHALFHHFHTLGDPRDSRVRYLRLEQFLDLLFLCPNLVSIQGVCVADVKLQIDDQILSAVSSSRIQLQYLDCLFMGDSCQRDSCQPLLSLISHITSLTYLRMNTDPNMDLSLLSPLVHLQTLIIYHNPEFSRLWSSDLSGMQPLMSTLIHLPRSLTSLSICAGGVPVSMLPSGINLPNLIYYDLTSADKLNRPDELELLYQRLPSLTSLLCRKGIHLPTAVTKFRKLNSLSLYARLNGYEENLKSLPLTHLQCHLRVFLTPSLWIELATSLSSLTSLDLIDVDYQPMASLPSSLLNRLNRLQLTRCQLHPRDLVIFEKSLDACRSLKLFYCFPGFEHQFKERIQRFTNQLLLPALDEIELIEYSSKSIGFASQTFYLHRSLKLQIEHAKIRTHQVTINLTLNVPKMRSGLRISQIESRCQTSSSEGDHHPYPDPPKDLTKEGIERNPGPIHRTPQTMFNDGLHVIYSFLSTNDWLQSLQTCTAWFAAGRTEPCRWMHLLSMNLRELLQHLYHSLTSHSLVYHIHTIGDMRGGSDILSLRLDEMVDLLTACPNLVSLQRIQITDVNTCSETRFSRLASKRIVLQYLDCRLPVDQNQFAVVRRVIKCPPSLTYLRMNTDPDMKLSFIRSLVQLRTLILYYVNKETLPYRWRFIDSPAQVQSSLLSSLIHLPRSLTSLSICQGDFHISLLPNRLLLPNLTYFDLSLTTGLDHSDGLQLLQQRFPLLTSFLTRHATHLSNIATTQFKSQLKSLSLNYDIKLERDEVMDQLLQFESLTHLQCRSTFTPLIWSKLCEHLPDLSSLELTRETKNPLTILPLSLLHHRLIHLHLTSCKLHSNDIDSFSSLQVCRALKLHYCFRGYEHEFKQRCERFITAPPLLPALDYVELIEYINGINESNLPSQSFLFNRTLNIRIEHELISTSEAILLSKSVHTPLMRTGLRISQHTSTESQTVRAESRDVPKKEVPAERLVGIETNPGPVVTNTPTLALTAQTLFVDGLLSVFNFLTLSDLLSAFQSSHYWYGCGLKERCRLIELDLGNPSVNLINHQAQIRRLINLIDSPLRYHINCIKHITISHLLTIKQLNLSNLQTCEFLFDDTLATQVRVWNSDCTMTDPHEFLSTFRLAFTMRRRSIRLSHSDHPCPITSELSQSLIHSLADSSINEFVFDSKYGDHHYDLSPIGQASQLTSLRLCLSTPFTQWDQQLFASLPLTIFSVEVPAPPDCLIG